LDSINAKSLHTKSERTCSIDRGKHKAVCKIAILGFGTVGSAVARILAEHAPDHLRLIHICNRDVNRKKVDWIPPQVQWTERFNDVLSSDADVIVELIGGLQPAEDWIRCALLAGKSVVTANKQVIADCGPELLNLAKQRNCRLAFGAAVAGGVPVISAIQDGLAGDEISKICGILNGTCNYILSEMGDSGATFTTALVEAQKRGYAEADPREDIDGLDARAKLAILARIGLHAKVCTTRIFCRAISAIEPVDFEFAKQLGCTIRQVSTAELNKGVLFAAVQPALVALSSPFGLARGSQNIVVCTGKFGGETTFQGLGAGGNPTAVAVVSDILAMAANTNVSSNGVSPSHDISPRVSNDFVTSHYVRFSTSHTMRAVSALVKALETSKINVGSVLANRSRSSKFSAVTVQACTPSALQKALKQGRPSDIFQFYRIIPILN
jgi:homoserine dehydrogenase